VKEGGGEEGERKRQRALGCDYTDTPAGTVSESSKTGVCHWHTVQPESAAAPGPGPDTHLVTVRLCVCLLLFFTR
jgi:hypothetical protein